MCGQEKNGWVYIDYLGLRKPLAISSFSIYALLVTLLLCSFSGRANVHKLQQFGNYSLLNKLSHDEVWALSRYVFLSIDLVYFIIP